jgi:hypothetical protein
MEHDRTAALPVHLPRGAQLERPAYEALCFYKIMQAADAFHTRQVRAAKKAGTDAPEDPHTKKIPTDASVIPGISEWSRHLFEPYLGKTFAQVDQAVSHTIRDAIAVVQFGLEVVGAESYRSAHQCWRLLSQMW